MDCPAVWKDSFMCLFYKFIWVLEVVKLCEEVQKDAVEGVSHRCLVDFSIIFQENIHLGYDFYVVV